MSPFQHAFDRIGSVELDLSQVQQALDLQRQQLSGSSLDKVNHARATSERTYLIRLLVEFEGAITDLGPWLRTPLQFNKSHGLGGKLEAIGKNMGMDKRFRKQMDDDVHNLRNELAHGGLIPRVSFQDAIELIRAFLRGCH